MRLIQWIRAFPLLFVSFAAFLSLASPAYACDCDFPSPKAALIASDAVFSGEVTAIKTLPPDPKDGFVSSLDPVTVTFSIFETWKGTTGDEAVVITARSEASCGYEFQEGEEYLVYADRREISQQTGLCSGTKLLALAQEDLTALGQGVKRSERVIKTSDKDSGIRKPTQKDKPEPSSPALPALLAGVALLAAGAFVYFQRRNRGRD